MSQAHPPTARQRDQGLLEQAAEMELIEVGRRFMRHQPSNGALVVPVTGRRKQSIPLKMLSDDRWYRLSQPDDPEWTVPGVNHLQANPHTGGQADTAASASPSTNPHQRRAIGERGDRGRAGGRGGTYSGRGGSGDRGNVGHHRANGYAGPARSGWAGAAAVRRPMSVEAELRQQKLNELKLQVRCLNRCLTTRENIPVTWAMR